MRGQLIRRTKNYLLKCTYLAYIVHEEYTYVVTVIHKECSDASAVTHEERNYISTIHHSCSILSDDRSSASSKTIPPHSAI